MFTRLFSAADVLFTAARMNGANEQPPQSDPRDFVRLVVPPKASASNRQG